MQWYIDPVMVCESLRGDTNASEIGRWVVHGRRSSSSSHASPLHTELEVHSRWITPQLRAADRWLCQLWQKHDPRPMPRDSQLPVGANVIDNLFCLRQEHTASTHCWELHRIGQVVRFRADALLTCLEEASRQDVYYVLIVQAA